MLSLVIGSQPVELPPDFSLTMNLKSPIFSEVGSYSYPFKLPYSSRNAIAMNFRHRVPSTGDAYKVDQGVFRWKGLQLFAGSVKMKIMNSGGFEGNMFEGNGDFNYLRKNTFLQDCDYGEITFAGETLKMDYINECKGKIYPELHYSFPQILNQTYFEDLPTDPALLYMNYYYYSLMYYFTQDNNRSVIVPMLYLRYVLKIVFEYLGFSLDDTFFTVDQDYNSLVIYNSVDCNTDVTGFFQYDKLRLALNYHVPRMSMNDFFTGLESFFNIRFFVNNTNKTIKIVSVDTIVKDPNSVEFSKQILSISTEPLDQITGIRLTMGMDTDDEFFTAFKKTQDDFLKRFQIPVKSISDLKPWPRSDYFDIRWVSDMQCFYALTVADGWVPVSASYFSNFLLSEFIYKNDNLSIETKCSTLMHENVAPFNCVIGSARSDWKDAGLKLFFTYYQDNGYGNQRQVGRNSTTTKSLFYGAETGLFNKHFKPYSDFRISTKLVKIVKQMEFSELKDFDFTKKYMINGIKYLIGAIQVTIKKDRIMPATLECYPCS